MGRVESEHGRLSSRRLERRPSGGPPRAGHRRGGRRHRSGDLDPLSPGNGQLLSRRLSRGGPAASRAAWRHSAATCSADWRDDGMPAVLTRHWLTWCRAELGESAEGIVERGRGRAHRHRGRPSLQCRCGVSGLGYLHLRRGAARKPSRCWSGAWPRARPPTVPCHGCGRRRPGRRATQLAGRHAEACRSWKARFSRPRNGGAGRATRSDWPGSPRLICWPAGSTRRGDPRSGALARRPGHRRAWSRGVGAQGPRRD